MTRTTQMALTTGGARFSVRVTRELGQGDPGVAPGDHKGRPYAQSSA